MAKTGAKVTIKKYANRRLYDTESSAYITLDRLGEMIREGRDFEVVDAKTGDDITHQVLTQIIVEEESQGGTMLPVNFLRQLIGLTVDRCNRRCRNISTRRWMRSARTRKRCATRSAVLGGAKVFADFAKRNMEMFEERARIHRLVAKEAARKGHCQRSREAARRARGAAGQGRQIGK